ncbi:MAG TPA: hypothetical protein DD733_12380 [Clostridiales bacterium]|nr:hypothetical protein [Clostridiales bacterium]
MIKDKHKRRILIIYTAIFVSGLLYFIVFSLIGRFPSCIFYVTTGFYCPGCGITRMFLALLDGDFAKAVTYNTAAMLFIPIWVIYSICYYFNKPGFIRSTKFFYVLFYTTVSFFVIYSILRNIPGFMFLQLD